MLNVRSLVCMALACGLAVSASADITVVDYWRLGENDTGAANGNTVNSTTKDSVGSYDLNLNGSPTYTSSTSGSLSTSTLAMAEDGSKLQGVDHNVFSTVTDNFGLECYVKASKLTDVECFVYNGDPGHNGWGLALNAGEPYVLLGGMAVVTSPDALAQDTWTQLALVRDNGTATLYVNGVSKGTAAEAPITPSGVFGIATGSGGGYAAFRGSIDEVRLFTFQPGHFATSDLTYTVPEPGTLVLLATGMIGLLCYAWRKRNQASP